jgi:hypothetical protein
MIERRVPAFNSVWFGTGTVVVPPSSVRCMMMWLLRCRTSANLCSPKIAHTSRPDRTRSLPTGYLQTSDEHLTPHSPLDLLGAGTLEEQFDGLAQVIAGGLDGIALAGDVEFRAQGNVPVPLALNQSCQIV